MIHKSIRIDLYQGKKLCSQVMIVNGDFPNKDTAVFSRNDTMQSWMCFRSSQYVIAYENSWKYGKQDTSGTFFKGYTPVKHNKRWLTPKIYDGAVDIKIIKSYYLDKFGENIYTYTMTKDNYVNHIQRKAFER